MHPMHRYYSMEASAPLLTHVLQAFPRDPGAAGWLQFIMAGRRAMGVRQSPPVTEVLGVLEKARFADLHALYDAVPFGF